MFISVWYVGRALHGRSADTNLAEIHEEMSELLDKQIKCIKREFEKTFGVHVSSHKPTKSVRWKEEKITAA